MKTPPSEKKPTTCDAADQAAALGVLVKDSRISQYFHLDLPDRAGVQLVDVAGALGLASARELTPQISLTSAATPVEKGRVALFLDRLVCMPLKVSLEWRLPHEGIHGAALLTRANERSEWAVQKLDLVER